MVGAVTEGDPTPEGALEVEVHVAIPCEAEPTVELYALFCSEQERVARVRLRSTGEHLGARWVVFARRGCAHGEASRVLACDHHVHDGVLDRLEGADGTAELKARRGVVACERERSLDAA